MSELLIQDKYLMHFFTQRADGMGYREVKANTVSQHLIITDDLRQFLSSAGDNKEAYKKLLKKYSGDEKALMTAIVEELVSRIKSSVNMAIFINTYRNFSFEGVTLRLFYASGSELHGDKLFEENIFSVVQELPYTFKYEGKKLFSFRPDVSFFVNGLYLGYSELKSNFNNQNAEKNGRGKVINDYLHAATEYLQIADGNDISQTIRKDFLKIFEKAIHITTTDINDTYIIRNIATTFDEIRSTYNEGKYDYAQYKDAAKKAFKPYPLRNPNGSKTERFEEVCRALYSKKMIEKEILYYNFIERELIKKEGVRVYKHNDGRLISPRPKQKFGVDKILDRIDEFLEHEQDDNYYLNQLREQLKDLSESQREELIAKRQKYQNNKNVYSLLLQYAAGFGKSNIIGWTALQLKDLKRNDEYVYDKVMIVVDRVQLRDQLDSKMHNMNISKSLFIEADNKKSFLSALESDKRIVVVNVQKFNTVKEFLEPDIVKKLSALRIAFLIDEIHRSNSGVQHEEMVTLFDELQSSFDGSEQYVQQKKKKNLIIGFTATPSDHTLARFGEFNKYAEAEKIWKPFDYYTMKEAIQDGYILNPLIGIVPVSAKMYYELPENEIKGFENDKGYEAEEDEEEVYNEEEQQKYRIRKRKIYENEERIKAIAQFVVERLVTAVYPKIGGRAKAMFAVSSIKSAIKYKGYLEEYYREVVKKSKYERFKDAPIYIVYSSNQQDYQSSNALNGGISEEKVLQNFALAKNALILVVDKLQTGFDEPKLHTLFLDKEISGINAIQTISRVNRTAKNKRDCKIVDFSYRNVNVNNIKAAFEHFSNVVVSDFDPFSDEKLLESLYVDLREHDVFEKYFELFASYELDKESNIHVLMNIENGLAGYIKNNPKHAKSLKKKVNKYFYILNLIEFVIDIDKKYSEEVFLEFWKRYSNEYNNQHKPEDIIDDVTIYFDNKIGIIAPPPEQPKKEKKKRGEEGEGDGGKQYKFNILKVIEKRNQEEKEVEQLIEDFEEKIEQFFEYIPTHKNGNRLIAKIKAKGNAFDEEEIYSDFSKIYNSFVRRNKAKLGELFIKETEDIVSKLCDDFEEVINVDSKSKVFMEYAEGYLYIDVEELSKAENVFKAYKGFIKALGFKIINEGEFVKGSWIRRKFRAAKDFFNKEEVKDVYKKGKRALELAHLEKVQAEIDNLKVSAAAQLLESVKGIDNIAVKAGSIVLVKTIVNGEQIVRVFDLTDEQRLALEKDSALLNQPQLLLQSLSI